MRIETNLNRTIHVDNVELNIGRGNAAGNTAEALFGDAGISTMNSTTATKNSLLVGAAGDGSLENVQNQAKMLKDNLNAMMTKMDLGEVVRIDGEGVDLNDLTPEEIVTVVEQIQIRLATWCDDFSLAGTDVSAADIRAVAGNSANAAKLLSAMEAAHFSMTEAEFSEATQEMERYMNTEEPSDDAKAYLLKNHLAPTIRNVYMAEHSVAGMEQSHPIADNDWAQIRPQVEEMLAGTPLAGDDRLVERGRMLLEHEIEVSYPNLEKLSNLDALTAPEADFIADRIVATMIEGYPAEDTRITGETLPWEETAAAMQTLSGASPENIMAWVLHTKTGETGISPVRSLDTLSEMEFLNREQPVSETNADYVRASRQVQEARLLLTMEAGRTLEKMGISINTLEISQLIDQLRIIEAGELGLSERMPVDAIDGAMIQGNTLAAPQLNTVNDVMLAFEELKTAPHVVLGTVLREREAATVTNLSEASSLLRSQLKKADDAYEALRTEVRGDLGDSLKKAVIGSAETLLQDMGYSYNDANRRGVSILAYHRLAMTRENMEQIKAMDAAMNRLFDEMTPQKTLQMIRDGIDPLNTDVRQLTAYLQEQEDASREVTIHKEEKYSEFLYRLEQSGDITAEERKQYIGIYQLVNQFENSGRTALGGLLQTEGELTMGNLMQAYLSGKDRGSELRVSDEMDDRRVKNQTSYYRNLFSNLHNRLTPENMQAAYGEDGAVTPEEFVQRVSQSETTADGYAAKELQELETLVSQAPAFSEFVAEYGLPGTINSLKQADRLLKDPQQVVTDIQSETEDAWNPLELLPDRKALQEDYDRWDALLTQRLDEQYASLETYDALELMRHAATGMNLMAQLARRDLYYIPYRNEQGEQGVINLHVLANSENPGRFTAKFAAEKYGRVTIEGIVDKEMLRIRMMCDSREGVEALAAREETLRTALEDHGFAVELQSSYITSQPGIHGRVEEGVDTERIFAAAKCCIETLCIG